MHVPFAEDDRIIGLAESQRGLAVAEFARPAEEGASRGEVAYVEKLVAVAHQRRAVRSPDACLGFQGCRDWLGCCTFMLRGRWQVEIALHIRGRRRYRQRPCDELAGFADGERDLDLFGGRREIAGERFDCFDRDEERASVSELGTMSLTPMASPASAARHCLQAWCRL